MAKRYSVVLTDEFLACLEHIRDNKLVDPDDWGLFHLQVQKEATELDRDWENISRKTDYPPLSTHGYRKRYLHSIPLALKHQRQWSDTSSDFRIVFKVDEEKKTILYLAVGKRIKGLPKDPNDIWAILKSIRLPEETDEEKDDE